MSNPPQDAKTLNLPLELQAMWRLLLEKWWLVALPVVLCGIVGFFYLQRLPRIYEATTTVQVDPEERALKLEPGKSDPLVSEEVLKTIEQNLLSPALAQRLVSKPELQRDPQFLARVTRPASTEQLTGALENKISAKVRKGTRLIDVSVEDESPALAQKLANLLVQEYVATSAEGRVAVAQGAHEDLRAEADRLKERLGRSERALQQYKERTQAISLDDKQNIVAERLKELNARVTTAKGERLRLETDLAQMERLRGVPREELLALPSIANAEDVVSLRRRIGEKETEIAALSRRYKSEHPKYIQASSELAELKGGLNEAIGQASARLSASVEAARSTEAKLEEALKGQEQISLQLSEMAIPYQGLEREVQSDRALYDAVLARMKEAEIGQGVSQHAVRVVAPALLPIQPSKPNKRLILLLSLCIGGMIGLSLTLGARFLDNSLKTVDEAEEALGLRAVGAIPTGRKATLADARRLLIERPQSAVAETFRSLRTALRFTASKDDYRTILFTSSIPGEGKSFCAINYAVSLAQQGCRTLIIDADLRLPSVGGVFFPGKRLHGTSEVLRKNVPLEEAICMTDVENLCVLPAGKGVRNPAELVTESAFGELLREAAALFDRVVIDTAPVHAVAETLLMAPQADVICFVVRAAQTKRPVAARAIANLKQAGAHLPGFVLNGLPTGNAGYYYHYHAPGYGNDEVYGASTARVG